MKRFARLFTEIDQTTKTSVKTTALSAYFTQAPDADKLWCIALFSGRRPKRAVTTTNLREWAAERAGIPLWLLEESYPIVGDLAETQLAVDNVTGVRKVGPQTAESVAELRRLRPRRADAAAEWAVRKIHLRAGGGDPDHVAVFVVVVPRQLDRKRMLSIADARLL